MKVYQTPVAEIVALNLNHSILTDIEWGMGSGAGDVQESDKKTDEDELEDEEEEEELQVLPKMPNLWE